MEPATSTSFAKDGDQPQGSQGSLPQMLTQTPPKRMGIQILQRVWFLEIDPDPNPDIYFLLFSFMILGKSLTLFICKADLIKSTLLCCLVKLCGHSRNENPIKLLF